MKCAQIYKDASFGRVPLFLVYPRIRESQAITMELSIANLLALDLEIHLLQFIALNWTKVVVFSMTNNSTDFYFTETKNLGITMKTGMVG